MARNSHVIPDLYFPAAAERCSASGQELQTSDSEEEGRRGLEVIPGQKEYVDLSNEGFIPIHKLTLEDLPEPIRTEENFRLIMDLSKRVVKINNNRLSDKRRGDKGMTFKDTNLSGSGYLLTVGDSGVQIITNRHVLFNNEEMAKATFDVFFHYEVKDPDDKEKLSKRCRRGDGKVIAKTTSKYDLSLAAFQVKDEMISRINDHCLRPRQMPRLWHHNSRQGSTKTLGSGPRATVCLISHPLGQAKQVSFGQALDYNPLTGVLHHNAPSRQGSSGAPVLVFTSQNAPDLGHCIIYHVGTDLKADSKIAQLEMFDHFTMEKEETYWEYTQEKQSLLYDPLNDEEFAARADASLQAAILTACAPTMGAFLLLAEESQLSGLDIDLLKPCKAFRSDESASSHTQTSFVKEMICKLAEVVPAFSLTPSSDPEDVPELVSLLESQGPCFCRSIVKLMERSSKTDRGTVPEAFLSPYTMAQKILEDSDVTWPWLIRDDPARISHDDEEGECFLRKCLRKCERLDGIAVQVVMLHLVLKANAVIRYLFPQHCAALIEPTSGKKEPHLETTNDQQSSSCREGSEKKPDSISAARKCVTTCPTAPLTGNWLAFVREVLILVFFVLNFSSNRCQTSVLRDRKEFLAKKGEESGDLKKLFSRCLALSEHGVRHMKQGHSDRGRPGQEESDTKPCPCGRPTFWGVMQAMECLVWTSLAAHAGDARHIVRLQTEEDIVGSSEAFERKWSYKFIVFLQDMLNTINASHLEQRRNNPVQALVEYFDRKALFTDDPESLMLSLASTEAILYNSCMFARYISKHLQPLYIANPVSVYGRPGKWPGNVTPPEVQRTAWRLIQDAIVDSGFPPAVLAALDEDAERRSQLIDVYVDMKQLKWEGKILPHMFEKALADKERFSGVDIPRQGAPFPSATNYFVITVWCLMGCGKIVFQ